MELDYSLQTPEERTLFVKQLLSTLSREEYNALNNNTLKILSDYILFVKDRNQTKKERTSEYSILTPNREATINKRQISYEGLVEKLEWGEDAIYNLIREDKNQILDPKDPISEEDIKNIPGIKECMDTILSLKKQLETASKYRRKIINQSIIDTWKQAYIIKGSYKQAAHLQTTQQIKSIARLNIPEEIYLDSEKIPHSDKPLSLLNPEHVSFLLQNYQLLKQETWEDLHSDMRWHLIDLENIASAALEEKYPVLWWLLVYKIDGLTNEEIQEKLYKEFGEFHSPQYYSTTWRKRIPKLISEQFARDYVDWYFTEKEKGYWKVCSKCGQTKLGHPFYFSHNSTKDSFYSQCKECKSKKINIKKKE